MAASISGGHFNFPTPSETVPGSSWGSAGGLSLNAVASSTVGGSSGSGFDSVNSASGGLAGQGGGGSASLVSTQVSGGNTIVHLPDGSSLTVVGTTHLGAGLLH